jgi:hypothetical protein
MLKEDSKVAVWMAHEVNAYNSAINSTFRRTAIAKNGNSLRLKRLISSVTKFIMDSMSTSNKKTTDHAKVRGESSAAKHNHIT